jgi:hypothetical protein
MQVTDKIEVARNETTWFIRNAALNRSYLAVALARLEGALSSPLLLISVTW